MYDICVNMAITEGKIQLPATLKNGVYIVKINSIDGNYTGRVLVLD